MNHQLLSFCCILGIIASVQLTVGDDSGDKSVQQELASFQGDWRIISAEYQGKDVTTEAKRQSSTIGIQGDSWIQNMEGYAVFTALDSHINISPSKSPKQFDHTVIRKVGGTQIKISYLGIYEFEGDVLKLCWDVSLHGRPSAFSTQPNSGNYLIVLKKSAAKEKN